MKHRQKKSRSASVPLSGPMFVEDRVRGEIAARHRSRAFLEVVRFLRRLRRYLPPEHTVNSRRFPGVGDDEDDNIVSVSAKALWKTPIGDFTIVSMHERSDIPSLTQISDPYLAALEQFCDRATQQDPQDVAKQFRGLIFMAIHFYEAYHDDVEKALASLDADDPDPFVAVLETYGPMSPAEDPSRGAALSQWGRKLLTGDQQAATLFRNITRAVTQQRTGRRTIQWSDDERRRVLDVFREEYRFCCAFKRILRQRWRNTIARDLQLANKFGLTPAEVSSAIGEAQRLKPREWAINRTASRVKWPSERVRQSLLKFSSRNQ